MTITEQPFMLHLTQFISGVILFIAVNWVGKHSVGIGYHQVTTLNQPDANPGFNFIFRIATPVVFLILIAVLIYLLRLDFLITDLHRSLWYYVLIRLIHNSLLGRLALMPWKRVIIQWAAIFSLGKLVQENLISRKDLLFPDLQTFSNELWLAVIAYLYLLSNQLVGDDTTRPNRTKAYVIRTYEHLSKRFDSQVKSATKPDKLYWLVYALMIVENFNRPRIARFAERISAKVRSAKTYGIMQVKANLPISDKESINIAISILDKKLGEAWSSRTDWEISPERKGHFSPEKVFEIEESLLLHHIITQYNPSGDYARDVESVLEIL